MDSAEDSLPSREAEETEHRVNDGDPEQESSDDDGKPISKTQKQELKKLDDQIESLLKIHTGDLFGTRTAA